jgi:adenylate cyclase
VRGTTSITRAARQPWLPGVAAVLLVALLAIWPPPFVAPAVQRVSLQLFDQYQRWKPRRYEDAGVRVVDIDEESIRRLGQWPWPRTVMADLNDRLADAGAAAIAYDIVFAEADRTSPHLLAQRSDLPTQLREALSKLPDNDAVLARSFAASPVVVGAFLINDPTGRSLDPKAGFAISGAEPRSIAQFSDLVAPIQTLDAAASGRGFVTFAPDSDAIVRRPHLVARIGDDLYPALSLEALRVAQGAGSIIVKTDTGSGELGGSGDVVALKVGQFEVPTTGSGALWVHFSSNSPARTIPAWQIISGDLSGRALADAIGGRIVFVGAGAVGLRDLVSTPLQDRDVGVNVHAQMTEQMILGEFLKRPDWVIGFEVALMLALGIGLAILLPRIGALRGALLGLAAIAALLAGSWYAFAAHGFLLDPTWPAVAVVAAWLVQTVLAFYREERQRTYIHQAFDRYLSPELVRRIANDPGLLELGGTERDMSVLFCDIRGFSRIAEGMAPNEVIEFLVQFLTPMSDLLLEQGATIDKYIGDAILAFWNAPLDDPDHRRRAARAALAMQQRLDLLNAKMLSEAGRGWPGNVKIGIGLNAGPCCVGNVGSERRLSYSLIGDPVNLASRLEGLTKHYQVDILVGEGLAASLPEFALLPVDRVRVVGRGRPETIFALLGDESVHADATFTALAQEHRAMLDDYFQRRFADARRHNERNAVRAAAFGLASVVELFNDRIRQFERKPPPADWDGVYEAATK